MGATIRGVSLTREASRLVEGRAEPNEPIFSKYPISGKTYTTAHGATVPNELQYYDGEMVHFYGECADVSAVNQALAGSGYKPVTLTSADGSETAVAEVWTSKFTDSTIGPYSAMFIVLMAVRSETPPGDTSIRADPNGASSVLAMLDGSFDPAAKVYENKARLFLVRLLDTTQVAIDVGRERMGTDKRPGIIDMVRNGRRLRLSVKDQSERAVIRAEVELSNDSTYTAAVAKAAASAGIPVRALPSGTEYVYPAVARIGRGPLVSWQWRSDAAPLLQPVVPGTVRLDPSSEEGRMLLTWGFTPKVLGYIATVRGVITGLAEQAPTASVQKTSSPQPQLRVTMSQDGGSAVPLFRSGLSDPLSAASGQSPVLRLAAQVPSAVLGSPIKVPVSAERSNTETSGSVQPRWTWNTTFLGSLTATLRKEVVGPTPDGLRINWYVKAGTFVGPGLSAVVLPGAADWMRIRRDGVAIVSVQACFEAGEDRVRVYGSYGGVFDLGPDGYARALRDEYDELPPVVVTPTYLTADPRFEWLNRAQCIGVGRVDMTALRVEFDVYVVRVGERTHSIRTFENDSVGPYTGKH
jgi:hypothetical protein